MTDYKNIKLDLKEGNIEELHRHLEDRSIKFNKINKIFNLIDKKFRSSFPWMYMFLTYKNNGKKVLFHCLRSIPIISMNDVNSNENSIILKADWSGDNVDNFFAKKRKTEKPHEPKKLKKIKWDGVRDISLMTQKKEKERNQFTMIDGQPPEKYISQLRMAINDISAVYVYNSGFEVQTDSPIDLACIKRSSILKFAKQDIPPGFHEIEIASSKSLELEQGIINGILEKEHFVLPSEVIHIKKLRAFWNKKTQDKKSKEVDAWLLGEFGKTEPEINVGQEVNQNILF